MSYSLIMLGSQTGFDPAMLYWVSFFGNGSVGMCGNGGDGVLLFALLYKLQGMGWMLVVCITMAGHGEVK